MRQVLYLKMVYYIVDYGNKKGNEKQCEEENVGIFLSKESKMNRGM